MLVKYTLTDYQFSSTPCVFLLGGFDGIHIGHQKLIDKAKSFSLPVGIMTIRGGKGESLFTQEEREEIFERAGIDFVLESDFTESFKNLSAEDFLSLVTEKFFVAAFVCGKDFRFGKGASGTPDFIREKTGLPVFDIDISCDEHGNKIGTRSLKQLLREGEVERANALLVSKFRVSGEVLHGRHIGRTYGFPTANIVYPVGKTFVKEAVYAVTVEAEGRIFRGIANYGRCPTFEVEYKLLETYLDGFSGDLYGKKITVYFDFKIRDIQKFSSAEELKEQLQKDILAIRSER